VWATMSAAMQPPPNGGPPSGGPPNGRPPTGGPPSGGPPDGGTTGTGPPGVSSVSCPTNGGFTGSSEYIGGTTALAAPLRNTIACVDNPVDSSELLIYGPFEAGFSNAQLSQFFGCQNPSASVVGGVDTLTAEEMVVEMCNLDPEEVQILDVCGGHANPYHYHERMGCLYSSDPVTGHSTRIGTALDGSGLYGKFISDGIAPTDLDACGGRWGVTPDSDGETVYYYMIQDSGPFTLGCFGPVSSVEECRALYSTCGDDETEIDTVDGTILYDLDCPCWNNAGSNIDPDIEVCTSGETEETGDPCTVTSCSNGGWETTEIICDACPEDMVSIADETCCGTCEGTTTATTYAVSGGSFTKPYYTFEPALLELVPGDSYVFEAAGISAWHPFSIRETSSSEPSFSITGGGLRSSSGTITFTIPSDYKGELVYYCVLHNSMTKSFSIAVQGCDGIANSGLVDDACGVCEGDGSSCAGCDGVANSGLVDDACGVCEGDGSSCAARCGECSACLKLNNGKCKNGNSFDTEAKCLARGSKYAWCGEASPSPSPSASPSPSPSPSTHAEVCVGLRKSKCQTTDGCEYKRSGLSKSKCKKTDWCDHKIKFCSSINDVCVGLSSSECENTGGCRYKYSGLSKSECKETDWCDPTNKYCSSL